MKISQSWTKRKTAKQRKSTLPFCVDGAIRANYCLGFSDNLPYEKVGKNEPVCIADEVPFDIPENWEWVRLQNICNIVSARRVHQSDWKFSGIPFYRAREIGVLADKGKVDNDLFVSEELYNDFAKSGVPHPGDLMVTAVGTLGKVYVVQPQDRFYYKDASVICLENFGRIIPEYLQLVMMSPYMTSLIKSKSTGTTVGTITIVCAKQYLIPIPPLNEQRKIVKRLGNLKLLIESYAEEESSLSKLNTQFPEILKKSILQYAVQGKLVPQDPADEPASVLLEHIRAEKEQLIKAGKIKRDKHDSVIFRRDNSYYEKVDGIERCIDDELPFEIPDSWEWTRMGTIVTLLSGTDFKPEEYNESGNGIPYITGASSLSKNQVLVTRWTETPRIIANKGDILLVCKGSGYGKSIICNVDVAHIARQIMAIKKNDSLDMEYIRFFLQANFDLLKSKGQGVIPGIDRNSVLTLLLPLPPLSEQYKISTQVKQILQNISRL